MKFRTRIALLAVGLIVSFLLSLHVGYRMLAPTEVWSGLMVGGDSTDAVVARTLRLPRALAAMASGGALALAGLLMQTVMRNPLAEPGLLGVNAGAGLAVVIAFSVFGIVSLPLLAVIAVIGSAVAVSIVFTIALASGPTAPPVHFLLAGVTVAALLASITQILLLADEGTMEALLFWLSGSFADRGMDQLRVALAPIAVLALVVMALHRTLDALMTDDDTAHAIGLNVMRARIGALAIAAALAGLTVSIAGPVGFVGLVAPHIARQIVVATHRCLIPASVLTGMILALLADILARSIAAPQEVPVGAVLAIVGVPVLIALLRRGRVAGLAS